MEGEYCYPGINIGLGGSVKKKTGFISLKRRKLFAGIITTKVDKKTLMYLPVA